MIGNEHIVIYYKNKVKMFFCGYFLSSHLVNYFIIHRQKFLEYSSSHNMTNPSADLW